MAAIGEAAAVIAVINLSKDVIEWSFNYGKEVSQASKEASELSRQLLVLKQILEAVRDLGSSHVLELLQQSLSMCEDELSNIQKKLYIGTGTKKVVKSLQWPFRQKGLQKFMANIKAYVSIFELALTREGV